MSNSGITLIPLALAYSTSAAMSRWLYIAGSLLVSFEYLKAQLLVNAGNTLLSTRKHCSLR